MVGTGDPAAAATAEVGERNAGVARNSSSGVTAKVLRFDHQLLGIQQVQHDMYLVY